MALVNEPARVLSNDAVGPRLFLMRLCAPTIARSILPGQFVHMLVPGMEGHILRRPFSVYARDARAGELELLYQTVGFGSGHMAALAPGRCEDAQLIGPVGRAWEPPAGTRRALLVGGGVGAAPVFMLAERLVEAGVPCEVVLGAQSADALVCRDRFDALLAAQGRVARCATDDGSFGRAGFCTSLSAELLAEGRAGGADADAEAVDYVAVCGPTPLMRIVADQAREAGAACQVSLERRMACGVGACLSCVVDTTGGKRRACVDGPIFDATEVVWS